MTGPRLTDLASGLPATVPFVGPETQERQCGEVFKARIGANESVFGPSPRAIEAMSQAAGEVWKYCDPENYDLRHALAEFHGVGAENILVGEGIDGILGYVARLFLTPGDRVVTSLGAYPTFNYHVAGFGGDLHAVPYRDDHEDPQALIEAARAQPTKLVYFANPDNPMGTWHDADVVVDMIEHVPEDTLLLLDEAYLEFAPDGTAPPLDVTSPNVLRLRTFSKAYGMAGARIGYAIGEEDLITSFNKIRNHFGVNRIAQAGALAALADPEWLRNVVTQTAQARDQIAAIAQENGLTTLPSATNFVAMDCGKDGEFARGLLAKLLSEGIFLRMPFVAPQDRCIRVGCGKAEELDLFAEALRKHL